MLLHEELCERIIGAAVEVHRALGPGLLESAYECCLAREFLERGISFQRQVPLRLVYKEELVECAYRADMIVEGLVILELKAVDSLAPVHMAQLMTYMKLSEMRVGYLMNFNVRQIVQGMRRIVL